ncbi:acyltransferase family protein [Falsirhodobacter sp. 20TX0035]|uniref:acyltransferase family protein n=1 Tax=Falsirhodobacter sp. 20TX0035 TaxID=3022019 RepID=UPI00232F53FC|nr:acyltransferase [Falsirhodobacter sp. 20TX0035]MDB6453849.1 acyltransferase [Falsirhodobacter sp. 20TX0035]
MKYDFIDVTRALAAFAVVVSHTQALIIDRPLASGAVHKMLSLLTSQGHTAVVVFFVISGFWITRSVDRAGAAFSFKDYMLARCTRLWLVLIPALLIGMGIDALGSGRFASALYEGTQGSLTLSFDVKDRLSVMAFLGNALFLQDIAVKALGSNGPLWTIACEFWYYVYFPLAYLAIRSRNCLGITLAVVAFFFLPSISLFFCWMMGGAVYLVAERLGADRRFHWAVPAACLAAFGATIVLLKFVSLHWIASDLLLAAIFALFMAVGMRSSFGEAKGLGLLARLGSRSSYSLYATHMPIIVFICNFITPEQRIPAGLYPWALVMLIPLVAVAFAIVFSWFTEDQTVRVKNWIATPRKAPPLWPSGA